MTADLVIALFEVALTIAESELEGKDLAQALVDVLGKGVRTYEDNIGEPLNPQAIGLLSPI